MAFKLNISDKGKSWKIESSSESLVGRKLGETIEGKEISADMEGYEFEISGASDIAGFPHKKELEGTHLRKVLLSKGWGMKDSISGIRRRKSLRGNVLSEKTIQINLTVRKSGSKALKDIFPDQNKVEEKKEEAAAPKSAPEAAPAQ